MVGHELGLVGGDVHLDWAVVLAALAGDAQVQGFAHLVAAPQVRQGFALEHLPEQSRPAAGGVALLVRGLIRGAHRPARFATALAHADATRHGPGQRAAVVGEAEDRLRVGERQGRPQVRVERQRIHDLARVHSTARVPDRLELAERGHELRPEHAGQQLRSGLAVAVLARKRAAVPDDHVGRLLDERAEGTQPCGRPEVELGPQMEAAVAEVAVEGPLESETADQLVQLAHVLA